VPVRVVLLVAVCLFAALPCVAAPAPFPKTNLPAAEVVFDATTQERARLVAAYLRSRGFAQTLAESADVKDCLAHLKTVEERRDWLRGRMRVTYDGKLIRVRLEHPSAALAALRRVTGHLVAPNHEASDEPQFQQVRMILAVLRREQLADRLEQMRRGGGKATAEEMEEMAAQAGRYEIEANPLKLHAAPLAVARRR
jgi:hypothetical protein